MSARTKIAGIVVLALVASYFVYIRHLRSERESKHEACLSLKIGMSAEEVLQLLGPPRTKFQGLEYPVTYEGWDYGISADGSEKMITYFNPASHRLVGFLCGEGQYVHLDQDAIAKYGADSILAIFRKLKRVHVGENADSIANLLRAANDSSSRSGSTIWRFPGFLGPAYRPTIVVDSVTKTVTALTTEEEYFLDGEAYFSLQPQNKTTKRPS